MNTEKVMLLLFVLTVSFSTALAGAEERQFLDTSGTKTGVGEVKPPLTVSAEPIVQLAENDKTLFTIRCWQNGQLILEETNWSLPQLSSHFIALRRVGNPAPGLYLVDFQHTFCELKQR